MRVMIKLREKLVTPAGVSMVFRGDFDSETNVLTVERQANEKWLQPAGFTFTPEAFGIHLGTLTIIVEEPTADGDAVVPVRRGPGRPRKTPELDTAGDGR